MAEPETVTYRGNCHCGSFVFETKVPEIKSALDCNCSICSKKGYLWIFPGEGNMKIVKGSVEELTAYEFGPKKLKHLFCPTCATAVAGARVTEQGGLQLAVNAHTFQGLNTWDLEKSSYDGVPLGNPYQAPVHKGELPAAEGEGVVYTGSCHCGAVTIATVSKPLDETYEGPIECNCSSCERIAALWVYCPSKSVVLSGDEANIGRYRFNERMLHKSFCKICGVILTNSFDELSEDRIAALPEKMRNIRDRQHMFTGVNARVLNGVDVTKFKTTRKVEGLTKLPGDYVNP